MKIVAQALQPHMANEAKQEKPKSTCKTVQNPTSSCKTLKNHPQNQGRKKQLNLCNKILETRNSPAKASPPTNQKKLKTNHLPTSQPPNLPEPGQATCRISPPPKIRALRARSPVRRWPSAHKRPSCEDGLVMALGSGRCGKKPKKQFPL